VPGVVSVMVWPLLTTLEAPYARIDRPLLEAVHAYLDSRRPLATELYVIGCEYIPLGISVGVQIQDGFGRDRVLLAVRDALKRFLFLLTPGGNDGQGWPLGKAVKERELEVVVARVAGVSEVLGVRLFQRAPILPNTSPSWRSLGLPGQGVELSLQLWQLPELLSVVVVADAPPPGDLTVPPSVTQLGIPVPVVPEVC
jgi:hypothetical protein